MSVTLELGSELERTAAEQAAAAGMPLREYVESVVRDAVLRRRRVERLSLKSFDEILEPLRNEVESRGTTDSELNTFFKRPNSRQSGEQTPNDRR